MREHTNGEATGSARSCGSCSLCCSVLRVDELAKLGGTPCVHVLPQGGCEVHARRPAVCRAYRCLWLRGGLEADERPDRLGAVIDLIGAGSAPSLAIRQLDPETYARSPALQAVAERFRTSMPVRITSASDVLDADRPYRVLLPDGSEQRIEGDVVVTLRGGVELERRRAPWAERWLRGLSQRVTRFRIRKHRPGGTGLSPRGPG